MQGCISKSKLGKPNVCNDNKSCVHVAVICDPVDLDEILEAYDVGDGVFTEPHPNLVSRYLALLRALETIIFACYIESM
jgi:hypothetical protein